MGWLPSETVLGRVRGGEAVSNHDSKPRLGMREQDERHFDDSFPYRRPSLAAYVAVATAMFAFIVLGGFIKTYRQLDMTRSELAQTRRENEALKDALRRSKSQRRNAYSVRPDQSYQYEPLRPLPSAVREPELSPPDPRSRARDAGTARSALRPDPGFHYDEPSGLAARRAPPPVQERPPPLFSEDAPVSTPVYGRAPHTVGGPLRPAETDRRIVAVDYVRKQLVVDGGRDVGATEGELLAAYRGREHLADLRITEVYDSMARCEFQQFGAEPVPGDLVLPAAAAGRDTSGIF